MIRSVVTGAMLCSLLACGGSDQVILVLEPVAGSDGNCGRPADARTLLVTALGDFPAVTVSVEVTDGVVDLTAFPEATQQFELQVLGDGGLVRATGKSMPVSIGAWESGDSLPIFVAPPEGMCGTGAMAEPRRDARIVPVAGGALIVGGHASNGVGAVTLERYDANGGGFEVVADLEAVLSELGLVGASATALEDGRVVIAGGPRPAYYVLEPQDWSFDAEPLFEVRAHHAAVAIDSNRILMVGGCGVLDATGACDPASVRSRSILIDVETGTLSDGPGLGVPRFDPVVHREADGKLVVVGGIGSDGLPVSTAERLDLGGDASGQGQVIVGYGGAGGVAHLGGEFISGFSPAGAPPSTTLAAIPDGAGSVRALANGFARAGPAWVELEEGLLLAIGGATTTAEQPLAYRPIDGALVPFGSDFGPLATLTGHAVLRLPDGSVLVAGGAALAGAPQVDAYRLRPSLIGPQSAALTVTPTDARTAGALAPHNVGAGAFGDGGYTLQGGGGGGAVPREFVVLAGPKFGPTWHLDATVEARQGGVAAMFAYRDPRNFDVVSVLPGQAPVWFRVRDAVAQSQSCPTGVVSSAAELANMRLLVEGEGGVVRMAINGRPVFECDAGVPLDRGALGLGAVGGDVATLYLGTVTVTR